MIQLGTEKQRAAARPRRNAGRAARALLAGLAVALAACASPGTPRAPAQDRNLITKDQLLAQHYVDAYQAVLATHSNWLRTRGPDSINAPGQVRVYLDGVRLGGVETLRSISVAGNTVSYIRWFDGVAASARWLDHGNGAILVSTAP